jgi:hypothetical protein
MLRRVAASLTLNQRPVRDDPAIVVHLKRRATAREPRKLSENASKTHNSCG